MRRSLFYSLIISLFTFTLASCGGGGSAGIGGTGISITSSGTISAFGSIFVNGVEFETNNSIVNGDLSQVSELELGMVVTVRGQINADGVTGTADTINVDIELEGPVANIPVLDTNNNTKTFEVLGRTIVASDGSTVFDDTGFPGFTFDSIVQNDVVEVSGYLDANGVLQATRIEKKDTLSLGTTSIEVNGIVGDPNLTATSFELIVDNTTLTINNPNGLTVPGGISRGLELEIEGTLNNNTEISATEIKLDDDLFDNNDSDIEIEGLITNYINDSNFMINGQQIDASNATFTPASLEMALADNLKVEVEGTLINGVLQANEVEGRAGEIKIQSIVSSIDNINNNEISLSYSSGSIIQELPVIINNQSKLEDDLFDLEPFNITDISVGNYLEIKALVDSSGSIIVTDLKRKSLESEASLRGPIDQLGIDLTVPGQESIAILGISHLANASTKLQVNDIDISNLNPPITRTEFFDLLREGDVLEIEDQTATFDGIADEIDLKN
jgi:hypothetical protein